MKTTVVTKATVVTPWHNTYQRDLFLDAWQLAGDEPFLHLQQDTDKSGCARTKNAGIEAAVADGATTIIILDDDCFPTPEMEGGSDSPMRTLISQHLQALEPQEVEMFAPVTDPPSRGTPYHNRTLKMRVAASMGFWTEVGDYDAVSQLVHGPTNPMRFHTDPLWGPYFPLCGMNLAFRVEELPWAYFVNVPRFDDIWQGFLWQRKAYSEGKCFNLNGPKVRHSRQSNVWANLRDETPNLERNETIWEDVATMPLDSHESMLSKLGLTL